MKSVLRYLGGKNRYAREIIEHFPPHYCYLEPCGGSAGVLLNKAPAPVEIYNDLEGEVVNFFRVLRHGNSRKLIDAIRLTPYSREELNHDRPVKDPTRTNSRTNSMQTFCGGCWIAGGRWSCAGMITSFTTAPLPGGAKSATEGAPAWEKNGWNACG